MSPPTTLRSWRFRLPIPPAGWLELDLDPATRAASIDTAFARAAADDPRVAAHHEDFNRVLDRLAADAARRGSIAAYTQWRPGSGEPPRSSLSVSTVAEDGDLAALRASLATPRVTDLSPRAVETVRLPAGVSIRARVYAVGGRSADHGNVVVDAVQYWIPMPGTGLVFVLASTTTGIDDGNAVAALVDAMADALLIDVDR
ncbi:MAG: hypothetical protein DLM56_05115 [Pseudonocardiales bacterium]|nr:MAG: hypothetical protein DLM56_05115 [Pseudonocardiales bacterium]